jgi:hypothetical protein
MKKQIVLFAVALAGAFLVGNLVVAPLIEQYIFSTTGEIATLNLNVAWMNGTEVTKIDWGVTQNNTEYEIEPMNITNLSNVNVTLELSYTNNSTSITALTLTWNYTDYPLQNQTLQPNESIIVELYQNCTATGEYSYDTVIEAKES